MAEDGDRGRPSPPASGGADMSGVAQVLDLSPDFKKVQLALMRQRRATAADLAAATGLEEGSVTAVLVILVERDLAAREESGEGPPVFRPVLKRRKAEIPSSLLDKL